jgi:hypothetical protein
MLYEINKSDTSYTIGQKYVVKPPSDVGLLEKNIENFIANNPAILFPNEEILVIAQSVSFKNMADVLALDATGNLIIIEIKRDHSSRETVGQLLEYAAKMKGTTYDQLNDYAMKSGKLSGKTLALDFEKFSDEQIPAGQIGENQRIFIVAPESDEGLQQVVDWLQSYGVPIEFVPFSIYADHNGDPKLVEMQGTANTPVSSQTTGKWENHWIFNTNETNCQGVYESMFLNGVAAIYGYSNGPRNLQGSSKGDIVLAYVNKQGLLAIGEVTDPEVKTGKGIFVDAQGQQLPDEYHIGVKWQIAKTPVTAKHASALGYNLPVRTVFGKLHNGTLANKIIAEMKR